MYNLKLLIDYAKTDKKFESRTNEYKQYLKKRDYKPSFVNKQFQEVSKINTQNLNTYFQLSPFAFCRSDISYPGYSRLFQVIPIQN